MTKRPLIFVGTRLRQESLNVIADLNGYTIAGILDYHYYGNKESVAGVPVIGDERWLLDPTNKQAQQWLKECVFFPGNWWTGKQPTPDEVDLQQLRRQRIEVLEQSGAEVINLIHPNSYTPGLDSKYSTTKLGKGILIDDDSRVYATDVEIGDYSVIMCAKITYGAKLGKNVCVAPGAYLHHCEIGDNSYIGAFSRFDLDVKSSTDTIVGKNCTIWAHSTVSKNIPDNSIHTHHGRVLKKKTGAVT